MSRLRKKVSEAAGVDLGKISSRQFSDGEIQINIEESVRGKIFTLFKQQTIQLMTI